MIVSCCFFLVYMFPPTHRSGGSKAQPSHWDECNANPGSQSGPGAFASSSQNLVDDALIGEVGVSGDSV